MSIFEVNAGPITLRSLMNKTKGDLAGRYMDLLRVYEQMQVRAETAEGEVQALCDFWATVGEWSDATFESQDASGKIAHLAREVQELSDAPDDITEYADCLLLIVDAARKSGFDWGQLFDAAKAKHEINTRRKWGPPNADGSVEHVED